MATDAISTATRFWVKADRSAGPSACWPFRGHLNPDGYGSFRMGPVRIGAHRMAWMLHNGAIPDALCVCHRCDNPSCVNPSHMFLGTNKDNTRDASAKGRMATALRNGKGKLSDGDVAAIRAAYQPGVVSMSQLARRYGVSQPLVHGIIRRKLRAA